MDEYRERAFELMRRRDWRGHPGAAVQGLTSALAQAADAGLDYGVDELMEYADALEPLAGRNVAALGPMGSPDEVARRMLLAVNARARQLVAGEAPEPERGCDHAAATVRAAAAGELHAADHHGRARGGSGHGRLCFPSRRFGWRQFRTGAGC